MYLTTNKKRQSQLMNNLPLLAHDLQNLVATIPDYGTECLKKTAPSSAGHHLDTASRENLIGENAQLMKKEMDRTKPPLSSNEPCGYSLWAYEAQVK